MSVIQIPVHDMVVRDMPASLTPSEDTGEHKPRAGQMRAGISAANYLLLLDQFVQSAHAVKEEARRREKTFTSLAEQWERETRNLSSSHRIFAHRAFREIVALGRPAIPLILRRLQQSRGHWFAALQEITGEHDLVDPNDYGRIERIREAWLEWGRTRGFLDRG